MNLTFSAVLAASALPMVYGTAAVISLALLVACGLLVQKQRGWFLLLFSSVMVVNAGYTLLAISQDLESALWANRISYLGSVFLPLAMLMIIMHVCNIRTKKWLTGTLLILAFVVFLVAASPGFLPIYYKEVSYAVVDGAAKLIKVYGPLHPLYLVYLLGYFGTMVAVILRASAKKAIDSTAHAVVLAIAVLVNICVWFIEQISPIDFEFLSVSYIISELFLLGVHLVVKETEHLQLLLQQKDSALQAAQAALPEQTDGETKALFLKGLKTLTPTEKTVFEAYIRGDGTKQVMETMGITENTLKFHNKNLYSKLGVSSRKQMLAVYHDIEKVSQMGGQ